MGEIQSAKPAVSRVASRNPVSSTAQSLKPSPPSIPSVPSKPSISSNKRPLFPIFALVLVLVLAVGGLFVYRFVFKKTLTARTPTASVESSPSSQAQVYRPVGEIVAVGEREARVTFRLMGSGVEYTAQLLGDVIEASSGAKLELSKLSVGQTIQVTTRELPKGGIISADKIEVFNRVQQAPLMMVGSGKQ